MITAEDLAAERDRVQRRLDAAVHTAISSLGEEETRRVVEAAIATHHREAAARQARYEELVAGDRARRSAA